jgi:uncharacterized membrane protein
LRPPVLLSFSQNKDKQPKEKSTLVKIANSSASYNRTSSTSSLNENNNNINSSINEHDQLLSYNINKINNRQSSTIDVDIHLENEPFLCHNNNNNNNNDNIEETTNLLMNNISPGEIDLELNDNYVSSKLNQMLASSNDFNNIPSTSKLDLLTITPLQTTLPSSAFDNEGFYPDSSSPNRSIMTSNSKMGPFKNG